MKSCQKYSTWTATVTPLKEDGCFDKASLEGLLRQQEGAGNGIVLLGSTGEALSFSEEEKKEIALFVTTLDLAVPVLLGIGGFRLEEQLSWISYAENLAFDGYLLVTPIYTRPGRHGQTHWFSTLLNATKKPCMLYNVPHRSGCKLSIDTVRDLVDHPNLWAIKEAGGSHEEMHNLVETFPSIDVFTGCDELIADHIALGAKGVVSVMANAWPKAVHQYVEMCLLKEEQGCRSLWMQAANTVNTNNPVALKQLLKMQGRIETLLTRPPLHADDVVKNDELACIDCLVNAWAKALPVEDNLAGIS